MTKYNYFKVKASKDIPEDINEIAEKACSKFNNPEELLALLIDCRKRKIFGSVTHYETMAINKIESVIDAVIFKFRYGIVQELKTKKLIGVSNIEERNIINDNVSFKKLSKE